MRLAPPPVSSPCWSLAPSLGHRGTRAAPLWPMGDSAPPVTQERGSGTQASVGLCTIGGPQTLQHDLPRNHSISQIRGPGRARGCSRQGNLSWRCKSVSGETRENPAGRLGMDKGGLWPSLPPHSLPSAESPRQWPSRLSPCGGPSGATPLASAASRRLPVVLLRPFLKKI